MDELSRLDADVLILVDLVADASRRVELIERPALFAAFREKAAAAPIPKAHELLEDEMCIRDRYTAIGHGQATPSVRPIEKSRTPSIIELRF